MVPSPHITMMMFLVKMMRKKTSPLIIKLLTMIRSKNFSLTLINLVYRVASNQSESGGEKINVNGTT